MRVILTLISVILIMIVLQAVFFVMAAGVGYDERFFRLFLILACFLPAYLAVTLPLRYCRKVERKLVLSVVTTMVVIEVAPMVVAALGALHSGSSVAVPLIATVFLPAGAFLGWLVTAPVID